ncbi:MAG: CBS domain-containing protein [Desulfobacteraceae bacterium]|nr:MAG: CBS domain-containing protein [Desulfobacteraceae bacterium]
MSERKSEVNPPTIGTMMIPLSLCARVGEETTLHDAIGVLFDTHQELQSPYKSRVLLVFDRKNHLVGKVDPLDLIAGVEDGYRRIGDIKSISHMGYTREFMKMMIDSHRLWQDPLSDICRKAATRKVGDIMSKPAPEEFVNEEDSLAEAMHRLALGHLPYLIVTRDEKVSGILRMDDIFGKICDEIRKCEP